MRRTAESSEKPSHGEPTFFVGKKVFAMYSNNHHNDGHIAVLLPAAPGHQENMIADDPETYYRPPYVGVRGWVGVDLDRIGDEELRTLIHNAWRSDSSQTADPPMKLLIAFVLLTPVLSAQSAPAEKLENTEHEFVISNFHTESGAVLPQARVVYGTYGHLNAAKDNRSAAPSHYMANRHGYEWLIGPGKALNTSELFLVTDRTVRQWPLLLAQQHA